MAMTHRSPLLRIGAWLLAGLALLLVFLLYTQPDFMLNVDALMWSCFGLAPR